MRADSSFWLRLRTDTRHDYVAWEIAKTQDGDDRLHAEFEGVKVVLTLFDGKTTACLGEKSEVVQIDRGKSTTLKDSDLQNLWLDVADYLNRAVQVPA